MYVWSANSWAHVVKLCPQFIICLYPDLFDYRFTHVPFFPRRLVSVVHLKNILQYSFLKKEREIQLWLPCPQNVFSTYHTCLINIIFIKFVPNTNLFLNITGMQWMHNLMHYYCPWAHSYSMHTHKKTLHSCTCIPLLLAAQALSVLQPRARM